MRRIAQATLRGAIHFCAALGAAGEPAYQGSPAAEGTLRAILREAGVSTEEFLSA